MTDEELEELGYVRVSGFIPANPEMIEHLPEAYNGCTCMCHRIPGVKHCMPCCCPTQEEE